MTRETHAVHDDIAYMRALAQEGRNAPLMAGPILVAAAVIFGAATAGQWALQTGAVVAGPWTPLWLWIGAGALFGLALAVLIRRIQAKPGCSSSSNRAVNTAWSTVGYGIFVTWLALLAIGFRTGEWAFMALMPTVVMVAYGSAWAIAGAMTGLRWMNIVALVSYAGAVALAWFVSGPAIYPVYMVLLVAVALVPGIILMRQERPETV